MTFWSYGLLALAVLFALLALLPDTHLRGRIAFVLLFVLVVEYLMEAL